MTRKQARELIARLNRDGERIAREFGLVYRCIEAERANVKRRYGVCYSDGTIRIRLRHATSGRALKYSSLVNTLCHELAHLKHFNHGKRFRVFYQRILEWARAEGIYQPRPLQPVATLVQAACESPDLVDAPLFAAARASSRPGGQEVREVRNRKSAGPEQLSLFG